MRWKTLQRDDDNPIGRNSSLVDKVNGLGTGEMLVYSHCLGVKLHVRQLLKIGTCASVNSSFFKKYWANTVKAWSAFFDLTYRFGDIGIIKNSRGRIAREIDKHLDIRLFDTIPDTVEGVF